MTKIFILGLSRFLKEEESLENAKRRSKDQENLMNNDKMTSAVTKDALAANRWHNEGISSLTTRISFFFCLISILT